MATLLRIVAVPDGEAPLWVREEWVGLSFPLAQKSKAAHTFFTSGVLTAPRGLLASLWALLRGQFTREAGFLVEVEVAVAVLATKSPKAAAWWREHAPYLFQPGQVFLFQREAAETYESNK
jgi:hypothetical protein